MRRMKTLAVCLAVATLVTFPVVTVRAADRYLDLVAGGDDMAPAIRTGDTVRVKICTDGSLIRTGSQTSEKPGDIIVYCAGAAMPMPPSMFACGRAISKRFEDGKWYFKTKMDNRTEADAWEVPGYALLGVVAKVIHGAYLGNGQPTSETGFGRSDMSVLLDFAGGIALGLILGLTAKKMLSKTKFINARRIPGESSTMVDLAVRYVSSSVSFLRSESSEMVFYGQMS